MSQFIRVKSVSGPAHEFDVSTEEYAAHPDIYRVVDNKPVDIARPATYVDTAKKPTSPSKPRAHKPAAKKPAAKAAPKTTPPPGGAGAGSPGDTSTGGTEGK